jgi:hypothetical protein
VRSSRAGFYFSFHEKREVNKRNSPAGCSEAKIGCFFPKSTKRSHFVALNGGRFFTGKRTQFLYASPQRPELIIYCPSLSNLLLTEFTPYRIYPFLIEFIPTLSNLFLPYRIYPIDVFPLLAWADFASPPLFRFLNFVEGRRLGLFLRASLRLTPLENAFYTDE